MKPWLAEQSQRAPNRPALTENDRSLDYAGLAREAARRAGILAASGVALDKPAALVLGPDALENACWIHALWWRGGSVFPLSGHPHRARVDSEIGRRGINARIDLPAGRLHTPAGAISLERSPNTTAAPLPAADIEPDTACTLILTSGSTAKPRAVPLDVARHQVSVAAIARRLQLDAGDLWLCCLPLEHIGGLAILVRAVITGAAVRLHAGFDATRLAAELEELPVTRLSLVPTQLADLLEARSGRFRTRLKSVLVGGAPCPPGLLAAARERGLPVLPTWGMSEAGSQLATPAPEDAASIDFEAQPGWAGPPLAGVEVRITDQGRIRVRGPMLFAGYLDEPAGGPDEEGWFETSDLGRLDARGHLYVTARADEVIISGGENVSLAAVEGRLRACGLVAEVALVPLADPRWGQRIGALYVPGEKNHPHSVLDAWCREHLRPAERPVRWISVPELPSGPMGKPALHRMRELFNIGGPAAEAD